MSARAKANQQAYYAQIMLDYWRLALEQERIPAKVLNGAFGESVRLHQSRAYGWLLLELTGQSGDVAEPPTAVSQLPSTAAGLSPPAELVELAHLEDSGWIGELLHSSDTAAPARPAGMLAVASVAGFSIDQMASWQQSLMELFERLRQGMDEC